MLSLFLFFALSRRSLHTHARTTYQEIERVVHQKGQHSGRATPSKGVWSDELEALERLIDRQPRTRIGAKSAAHLGGREAVPGCQDAGSIGGMRRSHVLRERKRIYGAL